MPTKLCSKLRLREVQIPPNSRTPESRGPRRNIRQARTNRMNQHSRSWKTSQVIELAHPQHDCQPLSCRGQRRGFRSTYGAKQGDPIKKSVLWSGDAVLNWPTKLDGTLSGPGSVLIVLIVLIVDHGFCVDRCAIHIYPIILLLAPAWPFS